MVFREINKRKEVVRVEFTRFQVGHDPELEGNAQYQDSFLGDYG